MRRCGALLLALGLLSASTPLPTERQVKAAFLYNFARFVEWPEQGSEPFVVGVWDGTFEKDLSAMLEGKQVHNRPLMVKKVEDVEEARKCQVLFISAARQPDTARVIAGLTGVPTLTVGETKDFTELGGMIGFTTENKRVRFNINPQPAEAAGLHISSQLLKLAKNVETPPAQ